MPTPKPQEGKGGRSYVDRPHFSKCCRRHDGKCLIGTGNFYHCGKSGDMKKDFPMIKTEGGENAQAQPSAPNPNAPKKNLFYTLQSEVINKSQQTCSSVC